MPESISGVDLAFERLRSANPESLDKERTSADPVHAAIAELLLDLRQGNAGNSAPPAPRGAEPASRYKIR